MYGYDVKISHTFGDEVSSLILQLLVGICLHVYIKQGRSDLKRSALAIKYCLLLIFIWSLFLPLAQPLYTLVLEDKV